MRMTATMKGETVVSGIEQYHRKPACYGSYDPGSVQQFRGCGQCANKESCKVITKNLGLQFGSVEREVRIENMEDE